MPKEGRGDAYDLLRSTCASCLATSLNGFLADGQFKQLAMNLNSKSAALVGPPLSGVAVPLQQQRMVVVEEVEGRSTAEAAAKATMASTGVPSEARMEALEVVEED